MAGVYTQVHAKNHFFQDHYITHIIFFQEHFLVK